MFLGSSSEAAGYPLEERCIAARFATALRALAVTLYHLEGITSSVPADEDQHADHKHQHDSQYRSKSYHSLLQGRHSASRLIN